ncbi:MAG TPA: RNA 3'-terminal phosphate cyclase [Planctomycetota bacterium]|jgi:RNA 3'-terminal phosphate cyclase (ATP)|nr:RNA 3'-terminal phosphate cyclase [Planctomycetota bacterium]
MLHLDGSAGEGGGQILRTALGLSLVTGTPFTIDRIRAGREKPGLLRQHLTAVRAAQEVGKADVSGAAIGSRVLTFRPGAVNPGTYSFSVGTAGSATLVLQTVLPALLQAKGPSTLSLEGGTHNAWAPPFDFLEKAFLPILSRMGAKVSLKLERRGFYPAGGGRFSASIEPCSRLERLDLLERGKIRATRATAMVAQLPSSIAQRELRVLERALSLDRTRAKTVEDRDSTGPGNVAQVELESEHVTELFTGFGEKRVSAEAVAERLAKDVREYLESGAPVGEYLADQLLIPLALAGAGSFATTPLSSHSTTNIDVIETFLARKFTVDRSSETQHRVSVS